MAWSFGLATFMSLWPNFTLGSPQGINAIEISNDSLKKDCPVDVQIMMWWYRLGPEIHYGWNNVIAHKSIEQNLSLLTVKAVLPYTGQISCTHYI